jgi:hypothetical protein
VGVLPKKWNPQVQAYPGTRHGGTGICVDGDGQGGVLTSLDTAARNRRVYVLAGLPADAAAVTFRLADGALVWQRPVNGMVVLVDRPGTSEDIGDDIGARATNRFTVLDADGEEIIHVTGTPYWPVVIDLRVDPRTAAELQTIDIVEPAEVAGMTLTWTQAQWGEGDGPRVQGQEWASTSSGFLGTDRAGRLWRSADGASWDEYGTVLGLERLSVADAGSNVIVSGRRTDGSMALLRSEDGDTWTEIDLSNLNTDEVFDVVTATSSGLIWLGRLDGSGAGVIAFIDGDRIVETYEPPWALGSCSGCTEIVEVGDNIAAFESDRSGLATAWEYLGDGAWSEPVPIPISTHHAQVGDTVLMFDHTNATCCASPIPGVSQWPLLASNDGTNWTQIDTRAGEDVHALRIVAGDSFWLYGPDIGGGGDDIEIDASTTLWISRDGRDWEPIDTPFAQAGGVVVSGNTIFLVSHNAFDLSATYWIGTLTDQ